MANPEHLKILKQGVEKWNTWRKINHFIEVDLSSANLRGMELSGANLSQVYLMEADLRDADMSDSDLRDTDLRDTDFRDANLRDSDLRDADMSDSDLRDANLSGADLSGANLSGAYLKGADLSDADLRRVELFEAELSGVNLSDTDLSGMDLSEAKLSTATLFNVNLSESNLRNADLRGADLSEADLSGADLCGADLGGADLSGANLFETDVRDTIFFRTQFLELDLSKTKGLKEINHYSYSLIHSTTLEQSGPLPVEFLRGCGLKDWEIEMTKLYQQGLKEEQVHQIGYEVIRLKSNIRPIEYHNCFISYSHRDEKFAKKIYEGLQKNGVRCWYAPEDMKGGRKLHHQIQQGIQIHDKLLLILSEESTNSDWVSYELKQCRKREKKEGRKMLFPIALIPYEKLKDWELFDRETVTDLAAEVREYFIPDFTEWMDEQKFQASFDKLLVDLGKA